MRIRRGGLVSAFGTLLVMLGVLIAVMTVLSLPRFQGLDVVPERLLFDVTVTDPGDEAIPISSSYTGTGHTESLTFDFGAAEVTSVSVLLSAGNLSDSPWTCTPSSDGVDGAAQLFTAANDDDVDRADHLDSITQSRAMLFNLPDHTWTKALEMTPQSGTIDSVDCSREGDLAPTKALSYRFFAPPIVTIALNTDHAIDVSRSPQVIMTGEWVPSDAIWTMAPPADHTSIQSSSPVQWRDSTLVLHDVVWEDILDRWNFVASALVGAIVGLAVSAIAKRMRREIVVEPIPEPASAAATPPPAVIETPTARRFRRRFRR